MFSSVAGGNFFHPTVSFMPKGASAESPFLFLFWLLTPRFRSVRLLFSPWACFFCVFLQPPSITQQSRGVGFVVAWGKQVSGALGPPCIVDAGGPHLPS